MSFYRLRNPIKFSYTLHNVILNSASSMKDLDVIFTHNLKFSKHIEYIVTKSLKILGFILRNSSEFTEQSSFKALYFALIRSILEYGSIIWSPYDNIERDLIKRVQEKFLKVI